MSGERLDRSRGENTRVEPDKVPVVGVGVVISHPDNPNLILCVVENEGNPELGKEAGMLSIPMGHVEKRESSRKAAVREALEETGYRVEINQKIGRYIVSDILSGDVYLCTIKGKLKTNDNIGDNGRIREVRWEPVDSILSGRFALRPAVKEIVQDYISGLRGVARDLRQ